MSNTRLFVSYALGRICGGVIGGVIGVVFLTWLVQTLSQQGVGAQNIACTIAELIVTIIFTLKSIVKWAANRPYMLLVYYAICMFVDIAIIFTCQSLPWLILGSSAVTVIGPKVFFSSTNNYAESSYGIRRIDIVQKPTRHNRYYKLTCWKWTRNDYSGIFRCCRMVECDVFNSDTTS